MLDIFLNPQKHTQNPGFPPGKPKPTFPPFTQSTHTVKE